MTQSNTDLRKAIVQYLFKQKGGVIAGSTNHNQLEALAGELLTVFQAREQQMLTELKKEVGKLFKTHYYGEPQGAAEAALELVVSVIQSKIGELNG